MINSCNAHTVDLTKRNGRYVKDEASTGAAAASGCYDITAFSRNDLALENFSSQDRTGHWQLGHLDVKVYLTNIIPHSADFYVEGPDI